jgi:hypothetical protein
LRLLDLIILIVAQSKQSSCRVLGYTQAEAVSTPAVDRMLAVPIACGGSVNSIIVELPRSRCIDRRFSKPSAMQFARILQMICTHHATIAVVVGFHLRIGIRSGADAETHDVSVLATAR